MRIFRSFVLVLLLAFAELPGSASAQVPAQPPEVVWQQAQPLTLAEAIREAMAQNPDLRAARTAAAPARERVAQAQGLTPPRIEAQIWQWPVTTADPRNVDMYMFMLEQAIPGRGKRAIGTALAESDVRVADAEVATRRLDIAAGVRRTYAALALTRQDLSNLWAAARSLEQLVRVAQETYAAGGGSQAGVVRALLDVTRLDERRAGLLGDERMAAARLNALLGRAADTPIGVLDAPQSTPPRMQTPELVARAAERHPEVRAAEAALVRSTRAVEAARAERRPDWMVQGGYMLMPGEAGAWSARVGLTWPGAPWARKRIAAAIAEAERQRDAAAAAADAARARVRVMVQEAGARLAAADARRAILRTGIIPQATHLVESTRLAFETGQGALAEALEARHVLLEAELDEARAAYEVEQARADLDAAAGDDWLPATDDVAAASPRDAQEF